MITNWYLSVILLLLELNQMKKKSMARGMMLCIIVGKLYVAKMIKLYVEYSNLSYQGKL